MTDINQWAVDNNCVSTPAFNSSKTQIKCFCEDNTICEEIDGVQNGCPCVGDGKFSPETNNLIYLWIGLGISALLFISYMFYRWWNNRNVTTTISITTSQDAAKGSNMLYASPDTTKTIKKTVSYDAANNDWVIN